MMVLFVLGYFGFIGIKIIFLLEIEFRVIIIQVIYLGVLLVEVEEGIVIKIEEKLKSISGIEWMIFSFFENLGLIIVEVLKGFDVDLVL